MEGISRRTAKPRNIIIEKIEQYQRGMSVSVPKQYRTRSGACFIHEFLDRTVTTLWEYLCLREAALHDRQTIAVLTQFRENGCSPQRKLMIIGHPTTDFIERFKASHDLYPNVKGRFGVPLRGYAGGYPETTRRHGTLRVGRGEAYEAVATHLLGDDFVVVRMKEQYLYIGVEIKLPLHCINNTFKAWTFSVDESIE